MAVGAIRCDIARVVGGRIPVQPEERSPPQISELVRVAQGGDMAAFEQLYRQHAERVFGLCLRMSGEEERAEELTQDVFVRLWEKIGSYRGESAFSTWLHRLAVNVVLGSRRAEGRRNRRIMVTDDLSSFEGDTRDMHPASSIDLEQAIGSLPPRARTVFVLHDIEGYRHEEIARLTGQAEGTSKAQLHRARRLLREALGR